MTDFYEFADEWLKETERNLAAALEEAGASNDKNDSDASSDQKPGVTVQASKSLNTEIRADNAIMRIIETMKQEIKRFINEAREYIQKRIKNKAQNKWEEGQKKYIASLEFKKSDPGFQKQSKPVQIYKYNMKALENIIRGYHKDVSNLTQLWKKLVEKLDGIKDANMSEADYDKLIDTFFHDNDPSGVFTTETTQQEDNNASKAYKNNTELLRTHIRGEKVTITPAQTDADWAEAIVRSTPKYIAIVNLFQSTLDTLGKNMDHNLSSDISHNGNKNVNKAMQKACAKFSKLIGMLVPRISMFYDIIDEAYVQSTELLDLVYTKEDNNDDDQED